MLSDSNAFSGFAVDDLDAARAFYGETLGLELADEGPGFVLALNGGARPRSSTRGRATSRPSTRSSTSRSATSRRRSTG